MYSMSKFTRGAWTAARRRSALSAVALVLAWSAVACSSNPPPDEPAITADQLAVASVCPPATRSNPELESGRQARKTIQAAYPDSLQAQGVGGKIGLWLLVLGDGTVGDVTLAEGSGHAGLDAAAMSAGWYLEFAPACREGRAADVWLYQEFVFKPES
jgi:TonB family protein